MATIKNIRSARGKRKNVAESTSASVLLRPRITEKATAKAMNDNVYVFEVEKSATKDEIRAAMVRFYKVEPVKIRVALIPSKIVFSRGKYGTRGSGKKAYIYLKKGDKIEFV